MGPTSESSAAWRRASPWRWRAVEGFATTVDRRRVTTVERTGGRRHEVRAWELHLPGRAGPAVLQRLLQGPCIRRPRGWSRLRVRTPRVRGRL